MTLSCPHFPSLLEENETAKKKTKTDNEGFGHGAVIRPAAGIVLGCGDKGVQAVRKIFYDHVQVIGGDKIGLDFSDIVLVESPGVDIAVGDPVVYVFDGSLVPPEQIETPGIAEPGIIYRSQIIAVGVWRISDPVLPHQLTIAFIVSFQPERTVFYYPFIIHQVVHRLLKGGPITQEQVLGGCGLTEDAGRRADLAILPGPDGQREPGDEISFSQYFTVFRPYTGF